jgi:acyl-coenzyme A thioesterase PaaI-like protein
LQNLKTNQPLEEEYLQLNLSWHSKVEVVQERSKDATKFLEKIGMTFLYVGEKRKEDVLPFLEHHKSRG